MNVLFITADGLVVETPRHSRRGAQKLAKAQRRVSKRQQGSKRRGKAVTQLSKAHQQVKRPRADFHYKTAVTVLRQYATLALEDLGRLAGRQPGPESSPC